jgi:hypothetical protein
MSVKEPLDQKLVKEVLEYCPTTGNLIWLENMSFRAQRGCIAGTTDRYGYRHITIRGRQLMAARLVWFLCKGEDIRDKVFHYKDRNRNNLKIDNLEVVSRAQLADKRIYK